MKHLLSVPSPRPFGAGNALQSLPKGEGEKLPHPHSAIALGNGDPAFIPGIEQGCIVAGTMNSMLDDFSLPALPDQPALRSWSEGLLGQIAHILDCSRHGDLARWQGILRELPAAMKTDVDFSADIVRIGGSGDYDAATRQTVERLLRQLHPWRKGPYLVHGVLIDSEWRSWLKWRRLFDQIRPLRGKIVLDVGCGNGYHCWRALGAGARLVVGIDPTWLSVMQFLAIKHFAGDWPIRVLPFGIEDMPANLKVFDTVFSMGVLYHRRSPLDHLFELRNLLKPAGELVLETLVIEGEEGRVLVPEGRYAQMRNVWFIPSCPTLVSWLKRCGYRDIRLIDVALTTVQEQRSTDWMRFQSLSDFLDPNNPQFTGEGLPAPRRAILLARSPSRG